jgi:CheY-like chemotaxis protein
LQGLRVLVVDDNATNRCLLKEILTNWQMLPTTSNSAPAGLQALEQAQAAGEPFALLLLDVHMPEVDGFTLVEQIRQRRELAETKIVMLTSAGRRDDAARCRQLGITGYLSKPIKQSELLEAISAALGTSPQTESLLPVKRHALRESQRRLNILLAEDNSVNQRLMVRLLEKHGHHVVVAGNGREALAALERESFDLVLMDVQMPEMDGFEATAAIRQREQATGTHIPILAMTAHAMAGDRERCLEAGMDGYVCKPVQIQALLAAIESVVNVKAEEEVPSR